MIDPDHLLARARSLGVDLDRSQVDGLLRFEELLVERAIPLGAIAETDADRVGERHILDCLRAVPHVRGDDVCDLGSGAGLPGIVIALARPDLGVVMVESRSRRAAFLELAVDRLGLTNAEVMAERVERLDRRFGTCLARAFAPLDRAWTVAERLLAPGGRLVYFAGAGAELPETPSGAVLAAVVRTSVLASAGPLVIMARQ